MGGVHKEILLYIRLIVCLHCKDLGHILCTKKLAERWDFNYNDCNDFIFVPHCRPVISNHFI